MRDPGIDIVRGDIEAVRAWVAEGGDINAALSRLWDPTPLHYAAQHGHAELVRVMVDELGANLESRNELEETPLWQAVYYSQSDVVEVLLILGANIYVRNYSEEGIVHRAVHSDNGYWVRRFTELGVPVDAVDVWHRSPAASIARETNHIYARAMKALAICGADVRSVFDISTHPEVSHEALQ